MDGDNMKNISLGKAITVGVAAGMVAGLVKIGWENILPPRTPERDQTNPPQRLLEQLGVPAEVTHATYTYSGQQLPWVSYLVHFSFSAGFGALYSVAGQLTPWIKKGHGVPFGLAVWDIFHVRLMPLLGTVPAAKDQPVEEHVSEILGHALWMWTIDALVNSKD
jgi:putative membrane protein